MLLYLGRYFGGGFKTREPFFLKISLGQNAEESLIQKIYSMLVKRLNYSVQGVLILKALRSLLTIVILLSSEHSMALQTLKKSWRNGINNMCEYSDGSVVNMGYKNCPSSIQNGSASKRSEAMTKEWLRLGQQSTDMMTQGINGITDGKGLIPSLSKKLKSKDQSEDAYTAGLRAIITSHPDSAEVLDNPEFINWVSGDDQRYRSYIAATSRPRPDLNQLNWLLTMWKALPILSDPYLKANQSDRFKELWANAMNDDFDSFQQAIREAEKIINQRDHNMAKSSKAFDSYFSSNTNLTDQTIQTIAAPTTIGECILKNSGAYLAMEWSNRERLGKFRRKFATIANLKAKVERALNSSGAASQNYKDKSKKYLRNIQQLQGHAIAFRSYMVSIGNNTEVKLLDELIDCRA